MTTNAAAATIRSDSGSRPSANAPSTNSEPTQLRTVGTSPAAAEASARLAAGPILVAAFLASGALAGLAGGIEVAGVTHALYEGLSPGHGYAAIAVALLARLDPLAVVATGVLFGALDAGAGAMQREAGVPAAWVQGVQALSILAVLAVDQGARSVAVRTGWGRWTG